MSDLVKRGFNLNGTLQFRIGSLNKQLRQWSVVCVVFLNTTDPISNFALTYVILPKAKKQVFTLEEIQ